MSTDMTEEESKRMVKSLSTEQKEQWQSIRNRRDDKLHDQRNAMLMVTMTFLGVAIPLYVREGHCCLMQVAIVSACVTTLMLLAAQRKLTRQMGEVISKFTFGTDEHDMIVSTTKWYEEICIKCWWVPFLLTIGSSLLAVFHSK